MKKKLFSLAIIATVIIIATVGINMGMNPNNSIRSLLGDKVEALAFGEYIVIPANGAVVLDGYKHPFLSRDCKKKADRTCTIRNNTSFEMKVDIGI